MPLAAIGFGVAFTMPAATIVAIQAVPKERAGLASAAFTTSRQLGSLVGVTLFGAIVALSHQFISGMHLTLIISGGLFLSATLLATLI